MKKIFRYIALVCASAAVAISCVEENLEPIIPAVDGDAIVFGVRAGFEDSAPGTKTEYSGKDYSYGGKTFERIDWVVNDKIEIYSPQAENPLATTERPKSTHYVVTNLVAGDEDEGSTGKGSDYAKLANVGEAGLRWDGTQKHDFYAMYPSSEMFRSADKTIPDNIQKGVFMGLDNMTQKVMVYGVIDKTQQPTVVEDGAGTGNYIAKPNMNYAYMVAKTSVDPKMTNQVKLSFVPVVTAVEIELFNNGEQTVSIKEIEVKSDQKISGEFTVNLSDWEDGYPECINLESAQNEGIQISPRVGESFSNVSIASGKYLKFTVFLLPGADIGNLTIRLSSDGMGYTDKTLTNANIPANLKTRIKKLHLPGSDEFQSGGNNWMEQLNPDSQVRYLSLPGTGGSFTAYANQNFKQQTLTFDKQWELGVRAFELSSDRPSSSSTSLGGERVTCNKQDVKDVANNTSSYWTVIKAIRAILSRLTAYPTETAALILTYQPEGYPINRHATNYAASLNRMLTGNGATNTLTSDEAGRIIPFTDKLTLEECRGKLILICRPNQHDESEDGSFAGVINTLSADNVTAINGCGTAKDRWGARGYKILQTKKAFTQGAVPSGSRYLWGEKTYTSEEQFFSSALDISNAGTLTGLENQGLSNTATRPNNQNATRTGYDIVGPNFVEYYMATANSFLFSSDSYNYSQEVNDGESIIVVKRPKEKDYTTLNFAYETNISGLTCWFQEWARVLPEDTNTGDNKIWNDSYSEGSYSNFYWFESYNEKLSNVKTTFDLAINSTLENCIYINSLCGYLATPATDGSPTWSLAPSMPAMNSGDDAIWGGAGGDIKGLSDRLNPAFYNYISEKGLGLNNTITGPTGIVLMDYVMSAKDENGNPTPGYNYTEDLISAIVANNKKYTPDNILTGGSGSGNGTGSGDGTGTGGSGINFFE